MEAAQKELAAAIESGDAQAQVEANKRIATLALRMQNLRQLKKEEKLNNNTGRETCTTLRWANSNAIRTSTRSKSRRMGFKEYMVWSR